MEKGIKRRVGELIRETRKAKGLTQKEMGEIMGITEATYGRYESGDANLSLETIENVSKALGVPVNISFS